MKALIVGMRGRGETTATSVDLVQDFWLDYLHHAREAAFHEQAEETLKSRRSLRAALAAISRYVVACANIWDGGTGSQVPPDAAPSIRALEVLRQLGIAYSEPIPEALPSLFVLTQSLDDWQPGTDLRVFQELTLEHVQSLVMPTCSWLESLFEKAGRPISALSRQRLQDFVAALGTITSASYLEYPADYAPDGSLEEQAREWTTTGSTHRDS